MGNPKVRIGLPKPLDEVAGMLRRFGLGHQLDELVAAMNLAAEQAIPLAKGLLHDTIQSLSIPDGHPKLLHCWPVKLLQAGRGDYAGSEVMIRRAAASLSL